MVNSIFWHEDCLKNRRMNLSNLKRQLSALQSKIETDERLGAFYERQIAAAKAKGLDRFDRDKFMVTRSSKGLI